MNAEPLEPYVGLRPFYTRDSLLFFGREEQITQVLEKLHAMRLVVLLGRSGCGKSSLVLAGVVPRLLAGFLVRERDRWSVAMLRPGASPSGSLAAALHEAIDDAGSDPEAVQEQAELLARSPSAWAKQIASRVVRIDGNLLVVVDQFEELFRFADSGNQHDGGPAFVAGLLALASQRQAPIFVILTMRSDFMGDCALFPDLAKAINSSTYLVPRMTKEELQLAIEGPLRLTGGQLSGDVLERVVEQVAQHPDQLPVLQLALLQTWTCSQAQTGVSPQLSRDDYESVGGAENALDRHLESVLAELDERLRDVAMGLFKSLTELGPDQRARRRPGTVQRLSRVVGASVHDVVVVIEVFRRPGRSFLMPEVGQPLLEDTVVDISHESLARNWRRLSHWMAEEGESTRQFRRLEDSARLHAQGVAELLRGVELQRTVDWCRYARPTAEWAAQYGTDFELAMGFLRASELAAEHEVRRSFRTRRARAALLVAIAFVAGGVTSWALKGWIS